MGILNGIWCGLDIHTSPIVACMLFTDEWGEEQSMETSPENDSGVRSVGEH